MAPSPPLILLPPSEGKAPGGDGPPVDWHGGRFGALGDARLEVRNAVRRHLSRADAAGRMLGVRGAHLERALAEWRHLDEAPTMPAGARYTGVVWGALGLHSLPPGVRRRASSRIVVPSGLWGLVGASDAMPAYRLKMGARVAPLGLLAAWWRARVSEALRGAARGRYVLDLLPQEHRAAIDPAVLPAGRYVRVDIVDDGPGGGRAVGHAGKALKGALARALIEGDARTADDVASAAVDGLVLAAVEHGDTTQVVFRRDGG